MSERTAPPTSSRVEDVAADRACSPGRFVDLLPRPLPRRQLSWANPVVLWKSRRQLVPWWLDGVDRRRSRILAGSSPADFDVDLQLGDHSFVVLGDPGEGDRSQYAVMSALATFAADTTFGVLCGDLQYPAGDVNDFVDLFYRPFDSYPGALYAVPGNHDWYDGLTGFLHHLCGRPAPQFDRARFVAEGGPALRDQPSQQQPVAQRTPYFRVRTRPLTLVCIESGIHNRVDEEQGRWLLRVSREPGPKVLITGGAPLIANGRREQCRISGAPEGYGDVHQVVVEPRHEYVAAIGGNTHNYQRYPVRTAGRTIQFVVAGGGGAFLHATHTVGRVEPAQADGVNEERFRCFPLRRDSLAAFSRVLAHRLRILSRGRLRPLSTDQAAHALARRHGVAPLASRPVGPDRRGPLTGLAAYIVGHLGGRATQRLLAPVIAWRDPPFFKNFLRIDVNGERLRCRCYGVTGCREYDDVPMVEDEWVMSLAPRD
ncbi:metallophosphoesterase [Nakamurella endophytica]|uniref:Metallophosphoesterase n=1 Tax=Nakamurella endophytica TaxID=1748367 RepID=A0A917WC84_9ACTN|nr:metallophosphoesterase [Nakamurella endophytica]GGL91911.1 metallophosphoesterase [Nakamurella endophytica]